MEAELYGPTGAWLIGDVTVTGKIVHRPDKPSGSYIRRAVVNPTVPYTRCQCGAFVSPYRDKDCSECGRPVPLRF
jgi:hypothetical protein